MSSMHLHHANLLLILACAVPASRAEHEFQPYPINWSRTHESVTNMSIPLDGPPAAWCLIETARQRHWTDWFVVTRFIGSGEDGAVTA